MTVHLEALLTTLKTDALEGGDTSVFDVPGAYLHDDMPKDNILLFIIQGDFVDIMCEMNPDHKKNLIYENVQKVLYFVVVYIILLNYTEDQIHH